MLQSFVSDYNWLCLHSYGLPLCSCYELVNYIITCLMWAVQLIIYDSIHGYKLLEGRKHLEDYKSLKVMKLCSSPSYNACSTCVR